MACCEQSTPAHPNLLSTAAAMSSSCVTLAEVLWAKGSPLEEEDIWALLYLATVQLLEDLHKGEVKRCLTIRNAFQSILGI